MISLTPYRFYSVLILVSSIVLLVGFLLEVKPFFESARAKPAVLAARWLLWLGTAGLLGAVGTGFVRPEKSVMFRDNSIPLAEYQFLGLWTAIVFLGISLWRLFAGRGANALLVLVWLSAFWILGAQILAGIRLI